MMTVNYSGACVIQNSVPPQLCQLGDYDIETLSKYEFKYSIDLNLCLFALMCRPPMWVATLPHKDCYSPSPELFDKCYFYFSFCKELPHGQCFNSAFCQAGYVWAGINSVSFGAFNKDQKIIESNVIYFVDFIMLILNQMKTGLDLQLHIGMAQRQVTVLMVSSPH